MWEVESDLDKELGVFISALFGSKFKELGLGNVPKVYYFSGVFYNVSIGVNNFAPMDSLSFNFEIVTKPSIFKEDDGHDENIGGLIEPGSDACLELIRGREKQEFLHLR